MVAGPATGVGKLGPVIGPGEAWMMAASGTNGRSGDGGLAFSGGADRVGLARELGLGLGQDHRAHRYARSLRALEETVRLFDRSPSYRGRMAETQREPVPRVDSGELDTALAFLSFARHCVLKKADGLSDEQLRRVLVDSGTSVLGLVQHLAEAERYWFGYHLVGAAWDADREYGMAVSANRAVADVLRDYRAAIEDSDRAIRAAGDPEARFVIPVDGNQHTLRWVMAHMTSETARHAGHADILREQLDGTTGR